MRNVLISTVYELITPCLYAAAVKTKVMNTHQGEDYSNDCSPYTDRRKFDIISDLVFAKVMEIHCVVQENNAEFDETKVCRYIRNTYLQKQQMHKRT